MKYQITTGRKNIVLQKGLLGSLDCYFSPNYSKITALNLGILCQIAYWDPEAYISDFIQKTIQASERSPYYPYIFRSFSKERPVSDWQTFEYAPGGLTIVDTQGYSFQDPENIYIAFRGTEQTKLRDWLKNASTQAIQFPLGPHTGLRNAKGRGLPLGYAGRRGRGLVNNHEKKEAFHGITLG